MQRELLQTTGSEIRGFEFIKQTKTKKQIPVQILYRFNIFSVVLIRFQSKTTNLNLAGFMTFSPCISLKISGTILV